MIGRFIMYYQALKAHLEVNIYLMCINFFVQLLTRYSELHLVQNESRLWQEWEQLEAEKLLFKEQKQTFEEERLKYLDAAKRLDREVHI